MPLSLRIPFTDTESLDPELLQAISWLHDAENSTPETYHRDVAKDDYAFYAGEQDTAEVLEALKEQNRPASTYNEVKPKIDMLVGLAGQTRFDPDVNPTGKEDEALADLMKGTIMHYKKKTKLLRHESDCFEHTVKAGRSLLYFYIDKENPFKPKIKCKRIPTYNFKIDPRSIEYDLSDARFLFIDQWVSEEDIKAFWPHVDPALIKNHAGSAEYPLFYNEQLDMYRVVEIWYRKWIELYWFINPLTGKPENLLPGDFSKFTKQLEDGVPVGQGGEVVKYEEKLPYERSMMKKMHYMLFSDCFKLEGGVSPYNWEGFPGILYGAYKNDDKNSWFGAITAMKDPQIALNTMRRQLSHLLQTLPKGLLMHEVGSILNVEEYEDRSADPSFHLELAKGGITKVKFVQQPQISPVYQMFDAQMSQGIKDAGGIQDEMMGIQKTSREPGVTVRMRQEANIAVLYILFQNYRDSRLESTRLLMSLIQQYVTESELIRIRGPEGMQLVEINSQMNPEVAGFNDISALEYDLEADETIENSTLRLSIAQILTDFSHNNPGSVPPDLILDYANLPMSAKERVRQVWEAMRQQEQDNKDADREVELLKLGIKGDTELKKAKETAKSAQNKTEKKGE